MVSLLLLLSFLIHLILFIIIFKLFDQIQQLKTQKSEPLNQLDETLTQFLEQIREENKQLELKLRNESNERANFRMSERENNEISNTNFIKKVIDVNQTINKRNEQINQDDVVETSLESKILQLYAEGKSIEEIARKLNRGKTEVELLIKLNKSINT